MKEMKNEESKDPHEDSGFLRNLLVGDEEKKRFKTTSGIELKLVYVPDDLKETDYNRDIGNPGEYPYTRGIYPGMYRVVPWRGGHAAGFEGISESMERMDEYARTGSILGFVDGAQAAYEAGLFRAVSFYDDTPGHWGIGSDNPMVEYQVGTTGAAMDSIEDFKQILDKFPPEVQMIYFHWPHQGIGAPILFAMNIAAIEEANFPKDMVMGTHGNDPIGSRLGFRVQVLPIEAELKIATDLLEYCINNLPRWTAIGVGGFNMRGSGMNGIQEAGICLAAGITYMEYGRERGLNVDKVASQITFFMASSLDFFEEVAKFRAARRVWARILREEFGVKNPRSMQFRVNVQTWNTELTAQQPQNNIVRATIQGLAAILGGAQSIVFTPYDEALGLPTTEAVLQADNTNAILREECGLIGTVDPIGGSYCIEALTNEIDRRVVDYLDMVRDMGKDGSMKSGIITGINNGYFLSEMARNVAKREKAINSGEKLVVGRNKYVREEKRKLSIFKTSPDYYQRRKEELKKLRETRDKRKVEEALQKLHKAAENGENVISQLVESAKARITMEEAADVFRDVYGVSKLWIGRDLYRPRVIE